MNNLLLWLMTSSNDPRKTSLLIVGILTGFSGYALNLLQLTCVFGLLCIAQPADWISQAITYVGNGVEGILLLVGACMSLFGLVRKIQNGQWSAFKPE